MSSKDRMKEFRTTWQFWFIRVCALVILFTGLAVLAIAKSEMQWVVRCGVLVGVGIIIIIIEFRKAYPARVVLSAEKLSGTFLKYRFEIPWNEVRAVTIVRSGKTRGITFFLSDGSEYLEGRYFDLPRIIYQIQHYLPLEVLDPLSYQHLKEYQEWRMALSRKYTSQTTSFKVNPGLFQRILSGIFLGFSMFMIWKMLSSHSLQPGWLALIFGLIGVGLLFDSFQQLLATSEGITLKTFFDQYELAWDSIRKIYYSPESHVYVLQNHQIRMVLSNPVLWFGKDKREMVEFVKYKIHNSGFVPIENLKVIFWQSAKIGGKTRRKEIRHRVRNR